VFGAKLFADIQKFRRAPGPGPRRIASETNDNTALNLMVPPPTVALGGCLNRTMRAARGGGFRAALFCYANARSEMGRKPLGV
jgi:hypothetical protein